MIVGKLVESAAKIEAQSLLESGLLKPDTARTNLPPACARYVAKFGPLKASRKYEQPKDLHWDDEKYQGDAYGAYALGRLRGGGFRRYAHRRGPRRGFRRGAGSGQGHPPVLAAGQIEGGVAQGIGFALYENVVWKDGRMINDQMTNYIMPTSMDVPPIRVCFEEVPYAHGPAGAKGIGELPLDGTAPAIANAIADATGIDIRRIPVTPEVLAEMMETVHA